MHGVLECRLEAYQFYARAHSGPGLAAIAQNPQEAVTSGSGMGRPFSGLLDLECPVSACWPQAVAIVGGRVHSAQALSQSLEAPCGGGHEELLGGLSEPPEPEPAQVDARPA